MPSLRSQIVNLGAGPSCLPEDVLHTAAAGLLDYENLGIGITELSHRSSTFMQLNSLTQSRLRQLLNVPDNFKILFMQGGGLMQFAAVVLNLVGAYRIKHKCGKEETVSAEYAVTGSWSAKAAKEAQRLGVKVQVVTDSRKVSADGKAFGAIEEANRWSWSPGYAAVVANKASGAGKKEKPSPAPNIAIGSETASRCPAFIYYCDNETVNGVEYPSPGFPISNIPASHAEAPLVADMSSNILSRPIPSPLWLRLGVVYAGAQKNMGPSGATIVIVREDLIVDLDAAIEYGGDRVPSMLWYKNMADNDSLYNTPPMFPIYVCSLVYERLLVNGGVAAMEAVNAKKADAVYGAIEESGGFYKTLVEKGARSRMNVVFTIKNGEHPLIDQFIKEADKAGFKQLKGHRSVGGLRISLYNAITLEQANAVCRFLKDFAANAKA